MKRFLLIIGLNFLILVVLMEVLAPWILSSKNFLSRRISWSGVARYNYELERPLGSDTLVLGCSVAHQLFPTGMKKNVKVMTVVDLPVTAYLNISKAIRHNPNLKTVILLTIPNCFAQEFENKYTYNLFVKPYYNFSNFRYFDLYLHRKVAGKPFAMLSVFSFFKILPLSEVNYQKERSYDFNTFSSFSEHYMKMIRDLTDRHGINLILRASPVPESFMKQTKNCISLREDILCKGYGKMFTGYFESFVIFPDSCFQKDNTHFKHGYLKKNRTSIIRKLNLPHF